MAGFVKGTSKQVKRDLFNRLKRDSDQLTQKATVEAKRAVEQLGVFDTGRTLRNTFAQTKNNGINTVTFVLLTKWIDGGDSFFYPVFPYFGLGTSRKYGARKWLPRAANRFLRKHIQ